MSYRKQYFEWEVTENEVLTGVPVGFEVEFSQNPRFYPVLYRISTFEEDIGEIQGKFYYSLDNGATWVDYPVGEAGQAFNQPYKIRLSVQIAETGYIYALRNSVVYRIVGDGRSIVDSYEIEGVDNFSDIGIQEKDDVLCLVGNNNTMYRLSIGSGLEPYSNSLNINSDPMAIAVDSYRNSYWEIGAEKILLKNMHGETIFSLDNPLSPVDLDYSSSSSESSSSSSSSSWDFPWGRGPICITEIATDNASFDAFIGTYNYVGIVYDVFLDGFAYYESESDADKILIYSSNYWYMASKLDVDFANAATVDLNAKLSFAYLNYTALSCISPDTVIGTYEVFSGGGTFTFDGAIC